MNNYETKIGSLGFADDSIWQAHSVDGIRLKLELVWAFQEITGVQINFDKCEYTTNNKDIEEIKITKTKN